MKNKKTICPECGKEYDSDFIKREGMCHDCLRQKELDDYYAKQTYWEIKGSRCGVTTKFSVATIGDEADATTVGRDSHAITAGNYSHATTYGLHSNAIATGKESCAITSQDKSHAVTTGDDASSLVSGKDSIACALGKDSTVSGALGSWLVIADWSNGLRILSAKVDGKNIMPDTWYKAENGKFIKN